MGCNYPSSYVQAVRTPNDLHQTQLDRFVGKTQHGGSEWWQQSAPEWEAAGHELVEHHAQTPHVR